MSESLSRPVWTVCVCATGDTVAFLRALQLLVVLEPAWRGRGRACVLAAGVHGDAAGCCRRDRVLLVMSLIPSGRRACVSSWRRRAWAPGSGRRQAVSLPWHRNIYKAASPRRGFSAPLEEVVLGPAILRTPESLE